MHREKLLSMKEVQLMTDLALKEGVKRCTRIQLDAKRAANRGRKERVFVRCKLVGG